MTEDTKKKRKVERHYVSEDVRPGGRVTSQFLTFGGKLEEGEVLHKFEMVLRLPEEVEGAQIYGYSLNDILAKGIEKIGTEYDGSFKKILFARVTSPEQAVNTSQYNHDEAQKALNNWEYSPRQSTAKKVEVSSVLTMMVKTGAITQEEAEGINTAADLERLVQVKLGG